jgi:hypothetical protein
MESGRSAGFAEVVPDSLVQRTSMKEDYKTPTTDEGKLTLPKKRRGRTGHRWVRPSTLRRSQGFPSSDSVLIVINRIRPGWGHGRKFPFGPGISYHS